MFDDEELEQIREERDDWQGHVDRQTVKKSRTSKRLLFGSITASFVMVGFLLFLVASGMMTSALIGFSGIGGFYADIGELTGDDIAIYPAVGPTASCSSELDFNQGGPGNSSTTPNSGDSFTTLPQLRGEIGGAEVPGGQELTFVKDVRTPKIANIGMFRINVTAAPPSGENLDLQNATLYLTGLQAENLSIQDAQIREFFSDGSDANPRFWNGSGSVIGDGAAPGEFVIQNAPGTTANAQISNATARAHFVQFDQLNIPDLDLQIQYFSNISDASNPNAVVSNNTDCPY